MFTNELRIVPEEYSVLITEVPLNPKENREKITQLLFDRFNVQGMYIAIGAVLSLYEGGRTTGLVVDSGGDVTHVVPIYEGITRRPALPSLDRPRGDGPHGLLDEDHERGRSFHLTTSAEREIVNDVKEKLCYVALDFEEELAQSKTGTQKEATYEMPDARPARIAIRSG